MYDNVYLLDLVFQVKYLLLFCRFLGFVTVTLVSSQLVNLFTLVTNAFVSFMNLMLTIGFSQSNLSPIRTKEFMNVKLPQIPLHHINTSYELLVSLLYFLAKYQFQNIQKYVFTLYLQV